MDLNKSFLEGDIEVLFVDDDPHTLDQAKTFLKDKSEDLEVFTTSSVEEGFDVIEEKDVDVVVSDFKMPHKDGIDFLKELRDKGNRIPFILFTGKGHEEAAMGALNLGANRYLRKDRDPKTQYGELFHSIKKVMKRKKVEEREEFLHFLLRHDLRSKLQITKGYHELLEEMDLPEKAEGYLESAEKGAEEGMELIEKVRTLREVGREELVEADVMAVIKNAMSENEARATEKGMEIEVNSEEPLTKVKGGALLEEIFSNLINNAIRHSGGEKILIEVESEDDMVVCSVEDDGRGIPEGYEEKIFRKGFKKGETAGSGLGLSIVKEIANSYGDRVEAGTSELGGAKFVVYLQKFE